MKYDLAISELRDMARACGKLAQEQTDSANRYQKIQESYLKAIEILEEFNSDA